MMNALWLESGQVSLRRDLPLPARDGEALVRVLQAGICQTDLELVRGYYPFTGVLGHEFVGRVESAPDPAWVGARVVGEINAGCGDCDRCSARDYQHCPRRTVLGIRGRDGCFAQYVSLPVANLHLVPAEVSDSEAVLVEPIAAGLQVLQQWHVRPSDRVLVIGDGRLGNLTAQCLALNGARLQVIGRHSHKLALLEAIGIPVGYEADITPASFDLVVDCTGTPTGLELAMSGVRPRGTIILKSTFHGHAQANWSRLVVDEVTVVGSLGGPFEPALRLLAAGRLTVRPLVTSSFPLAEGEAALAAAAQPDQVKVLLTAED